MPKVIGGTLAAHREHVITKIYDAMRTLLYERGYDALSLAEVASGAGMSRTAMYNYFPDKEALLVGFAIHEVDGYLSGLDDALRAVDNPIDQLRTYLRMQLEYFSGNHLPPGPTLSALLPEHAAREVGAHVRVLEDRLHAIVRSGHDTRYLVADDLPATVSLISACINRGSAVADPDGSALADTIASTEAFVLRAVGARLGPDGEPRKITRR